MLHMQLIISQGYIIPGIAIIHDVVVVY